MHNVGPKPETCAITTRLDKVRNPEGPLYAISKKGLLLDIVSLTLLDKCINCPFGRKRELSISSGMTEIKCMKWGLNSEI